MTRIKIDMIRVFLSLHFKLANRSITFLVSNPVGAVEGFY